MKKKQMLSLKNRIKTKTFLKKKKKKKSSNWYKVDYKIQDTDGFHKTCPSAGILLGNLVLTQLLYRAPRWLVSFSDPSNLRGRCTRAPDTSRSRLGSRAHAIQTHNRDGIYTKYFPVHTD